MRIVFMGTPDFAVPTLKELIKAHDVVAVVTQPDKPVGRKQVLTPPPVKIAAEDAGIKVFQPQKVKNNVEFISEISEIKPDVIVVVAYGKILPAELLKLPPLGAVNGHGSLLPKYRGASPIQWCIVCGEKTTGITTMLMDEGMDTGDMLLTYKTSIGENETAEELYGRLSVACADLMVRTLEALKKGTVIPQKQDSSIATYAPVIRKEMALIDFSENAETVNNKIRGFNSWPVAYTFLGEKRFKIYSAQVVKDMSGESGRVENKSGELFVYCSNNSAIKLITVQLEGKNIMNVADLIKGHSIPSGTKLG